MIELPTNVTAALVAVHRILVRMRSMARKQEFDDTTLVDLLDRVEVLPMRVLDGDLTTCFQEIEALAKAYPGFAAVWDELEHAVGPVPAVTEN
jgi:hypothetical protein